METITQTLEEAAQQILSLGSTFIVIAIVLSIIPYILFAIGLSSVANRCGIKHGWYAWLPIARKHLLAEIADVRRVQARKRKKLETQFEIITCSLLACIYLTYKTSSPLFLIVSLILIGLLSYNQIFSYYYFYRLCDQENTTIYFLLGILASPLNSFFVYHCR